MSRKMKINWIMAAANMSGGTKSNRLIAEAMVRRGHRVTVAYPDVPRPLPPVTRPRVLFRRVFHDLATRDKQPHHLEQSTARLLPVPHRPIVASDVPDADVTIGTWWETMEWIRDWPSRKGVHAYFVRGYELHGGDPERVKATYRQAALKLVISRWLQRIMAEEFGDNHAVLVPNGVDWDQFDSTVRLQSSTPTVGVMYGASRLKGFDTAAKALEHIEAQLPTVRIICFGSSKLPRKYRRFRNVVYYLRPPQHMIPELYRQADCWLVSSTSEGFGMPGLEAAACRCPIVSTRCGGPEDYVEDGVNGYLVPVGDPDAMAEATLRILRADPMEWQRMSEASYAIAQRFNWDRSAEILENALLDALDAGAQRTEAEQTMKTAIS